MPIISDENNGDYLQRKCSHFSLLPEDGIEFVFLIKIVN